MGGDDRRGDAARSVGPVILAGAPLSYWTGVRGENPMRYTGGLVGGTWITALMGDLGAGTFDGAWLVTNFENLDPSNTYWTKNYNLYSKVDTKRLRYLEFEQWWGGHVLLMPKRCSSLPTNCSLATNSLQEI